MSGRARLGPSRPLCRVERVHADLYAAYCPHCYAEVLVSVQRVVRPRDPGPVRVTGSCERCGGWWHADGPYARWVGDDGEEG